MTVGLVLAGGGARGAYEAGVLVELLPWLEERGERPTVLVGTSVGALTAAFLASVAHLPAREAADQRRLARWGAVTQERVIRPIRGTSRRARCCAIWPRSPASRPCGSSRSWTPRRCGAR